MYGMYVHIKAVTCVTFPNKQDFLPKLIRLKIQEELSNTYILAVCPYNVCDVLPCQLNMGVGHSAHQLNLNAASF